MAFKLFYPSDNTGAFEEFDDEAKYRFNDHGLLVITTGDGVRQTYSPSAWLYVQDHRKPREQRVARIR
ncbi:hypothetical protein [Solicola gregarius]|uniref:Uncharacterized protein n=1 Tax=Solicola gregarius TaxID=2908642 RepID=A0AA46YJD6_9ACTN|nr:hypothetical protein [Solicola gregarius]UYM03449.1 hypothetical protein L0C25_12870 [Solicola gregarius]